MDRRSLIVSAVGGVVTAGSLRATPFHVVLIGLRLILGGMGRRTVLQTVASRGSFAARNGLTLNEAGSALASSVARQSATQVVTNVVADTFDVGDRRSDVAVLEVNNPTQEWKHVPTIAYRETRLEDGEEYTWTASPTSVHPMSTLRFQPELTRIRRPGTYLREAYFPHGHGAAEVDYSPSFVVIGNPQADLRDLRCPILIPPGTRPHWHGQSRCDAALMDHRMPVQPRSEGFFKTAGKVLVGGAVLYGVYRLSR
jgi:hypothetical protein